MDSKSFLIACGGTGGHLFPGIAIGEKLIEKGGEVAFLISGKEIDRLATEKYGHLDFEVVPSAIFPKPWSPKMVAFLSVSSKGVAKCRSLIKDRGVKAVLGMGGFTSTTPLVAAKMSGIPGLIHESNAIPGRANRLNAKIAQRALVGWEACRAHFPSGKVDVVGTPVRPELFDLPPASEAKESFGLMPDLFTVLVMGGSQGAKGINDAVTGMLPRLPSDRIQFLHITGMGAAEEVRNRYQLAGVRSEVLEFCSEMAKAYAASDFSICRSGASSLTEMSVVSLPGLLVPYPFAADDHQTRNAEVFVEAGACVMKEQSELQSDEVAEMIVSLLEHPEELQNMRDGMSALAPRKSADDIAELLFSLTS
ncbi:MAG: undecaprenyldiphospho-muramoylpentapeptide beta-N-acetylglucosaminyltransferase [Verrucomicrobiota bacterium]